MTNCRRCCCCCCCCCCRCYWAEWNYLSHQKNEESNNSLAISTFCLKNCFNTRMSYAGSVTEKSSAYTNVFWVLTLHVMQGRNWNIGKTLLTVNIFWLLKRLIFFDCLKYCVFSLTQISKKCFSPIVRRWTARKQTPAHIRNPFMSCTWCIK